MPYDPSAVTHFPATPEQEPVTVAALDARLSNLRASLIQWTVGALIGGLSIGMGVAAAVGAAIARFGGVPMP